LTICAYTRILRFIEIDSCFYMPTTPEKYQQLNDCTCDLMRKTARSITQFYDGFLNQAEIKSSQFAILGALANTGSITVSELAKTVSIERTGLTRNLAILERNGWVQIQICAIDSRQRIVSLSKGGYKQLDRAIPYWEQAHEIISSSIEANPHAGLLQSIKGIEKVLKQ